MKLLHRVASFLPACAIGIGVALAQAPSAPVPAAQAPDLAPIAYTPVDPATVPHIEFDIATFKPSRTDNFNRTFVIPADGDGFTFTGRPIHDVIRYAFARGRGGAYQISGQPAWVDSDLYDVQARVAPEDIAKWKALDAYQKRVAIQRFVIQYFKLQYHQDESDHPYYALVVGKGGPKMKVAQPGETYKSPGGQAIAPHTVQTPTGSDLNGYSCEMERLADWLSGYADRPVLDRTGLRNYYDFTLHFDGATNPNNPSAPEVPFLALKPNDATPSIFSAVKTLGLEIKAAKGPIDGMVVDHIERPEN